MSSIGGRGEAVSPSWGDKGKQKEHVYGNQLQFYLGFFRMGSVLGIKEVIINGS